MRLSHPYARKGHLNWLVFFFLLRYLTFRKMLFQCKRGLIGFLRKPPIYGPQFFLYLLVLHNQTDYSFYLIGFLLKCSPSLSLKGLFLLAQGQKSLLLCLFWKGPLYLFL